MGRRVRFQDTFMWAAQRAVRSARLRYFFLSVALCEPMKEERFVKGEANDGNHNARPIEARIWEELVKCEASHQRRVADTVSAAFASWGRRHWPKPENVGRGKTRAKEPRPAEWGAGKRQVNQQQKQEPASLQQQTMPLPTSKIPAEEQTSPFQSLQVCPLTRPHWHFCSSMHARTHSHALAFSLLFLIAYSLLVLAAALLEF